MAKYPTHNAIKVSRETYLLAKKLADERGCFIGRLLTDALKHFAATNPTQQQTPKEEAA